MEKIKKILSELSNAHGISGYEDMTREIVIKYLEKLVDRVEIDVLGNVIGIKDGNDFKVMVAAHMDEIGFMVKHIDDNGFIRFAPIGGWFSQVVLSQRVVLHTQKGAIYGVVGSKPPHVMKEDEKGKAIKLEDMFIDVGAKDKDDAKSMGIEPGVPITPDRETVDLANNRITGKAFDDRAGIAMMLRALEMIETDATVYAVGTVQEEVGLKGARTSAFGLNPDVALVAEVGIPADHPGMEKKYSDTKLGEGPMITVIDASGRGLITPKSVLEWLKNTAEEHGIKYQLEVAEGGTTDATVIHLTRSGIPVGVVGVPTRYIHTPVEVLSLEDLLNGSRLIARAVESAHKYFGRKE